MSQLETNKLNNSEVKEVSHLNNSLPQEKLSNQQYFDQGLKEDLANIPERVYFKIGEVANLLNVKTSVLRYWETEFTSFSPSKSGKNQRVYKKRDVEQLFLIKKLLYKDRFSIEGARAILTKAKKEFKGFHCEQKIKTKVKQGISLTQLLLLDIKKCKKLFV